jgi:pimeloyl-ACP methyl ester carboxylesterase
MGGAILLTFALDYPDRVAGIGLISTGSRLPIQSSILENVANTSTFPLAVKALLEMSLGSQTPAFLKETTLKYLSAVRQTLLLGDLLACDRFDVTQRLDTVRTPTLIVCGTEDKLTPVRFSETLASRIPGAALQTVDETGHMLPMEKPHRLAKLLGVFLATIPYIPGM